MMRGRGMAVAGVALLVVIAVGILLLSEPAPTPFDVGSSAPDGYRALRILLEDQGIEVGNRSAAEVLADPPPPGSAIVVPVWSYLDDTQRARMRDLAASGRLLVLSGSEYFFAEDGGYLAHTPADPVSRGACDIERLDDLEAIDDLVGAGLSPGEGARVCFGDPSWVAVTEEGLGDGSVVELSSPYLWANARLQPDKEEGGRPLDNGPMAVALLGQSSSVTFVEARPTPGVTPEGTRNPLDLMPYGVKLALAQGIGAFVVYAWWRGRRLGRPVREEMPVEVAGSELVEAVGGLLRRAGSVDGAAQIVRADACRTLGARLGVPAESGPDALVRLVSARTGRDPAEVGAVLVWGPVGSAEGLVQLLRQLDSLRTEVLDGQPVA
jgi:hypothetical protein